MKFNNNKQSFTVFTLLSFCAIATSTTIAAVEPLARKEDFTPKVVEQSEQQEQQKLFEPLSQGNSETLEEINLEHEWEGILSDDESGEEILLVNRTI